MSRLEARISGPRLRRWKARRDVARLDPDPTLTATMGEDARRTIEEADIIASSQGGPDRFCRGATIPPGAKRQDACRQAPPCRWIGE